jgi:hypothetical protein
VLFAVNQRRWEMSEKGGYIYTVGKVNELGSRIRKNQFILTVKLLLKNM